MGGAITIAINLAFYILIITDFMNVTQGKMDSY
jgi:hypothetical protein